MLGYLTRSVFRMKITTNHTRSLATYASATKGDKTMLLSALRFNNTSKPSTESDTAQPGRRQSCAQLLQRGRWRRSLYLALLLLFMLLVAESRAADKIIYIRPVPMNEDPLLKLGTTGVNQAALMYGMEASTLASQPTREGRQPQLDAALKQNPKVV